MLPTTKSAIVVLRHLTQNKLSHDKASKEISKLVYAKWYHDSIYCLSQRSFREGKKRYNESTNKYKSTVDKYKQIVADAQKLFDVKTSDEEKCKQEWGVDMTEREREYYQNMKNERNMQCDHRVDPVWYTVMMKRQRERERCEKYRRDLKEQFRSVDIDKITSILNEEGALLSQDELEGDSERERKCTGTNRK